MCHPLCTPTQEHRRIRGEYEARLRELEAERHMVEEDLAQVDRCDDGVQVVARVSLEELSTSRGPIAAPVTSPAKLCVHIAA